MDQGIAEAMNMNLTPRPNGYPCVGGNSYSGEIPERIIERLAERTAFSALRVPRTRKACDLWLGGLNGAGRPQIHWFDGTMDVVAPVGGLIYRIHRLDGEPLPPGMLICHACDVYTCIHPDHLYLGDSHMNRSDLRRRGSAADQGVARMEVFAQLTLRREHGIEIPKGLVRRAKALGLNLDGTPILTGTRTGRMTVRG
jgi:hypothetical protein